MRIRRVLVVDDDDALTPILEVSLGQLGGWEVSFAASGEEAVERAGAVAPDLLLVDLNLRGMEGPETVRALRGIGVDAPAVLLTAAARPPELTELAEWGVIGVLGKPFDPMTLPDELRRLVAERDGGEGDG